MSGVANGLTTEDVRRLLAEHGPNALPEARPVRLWLRFARQFKSPLIYMLLFAMVFNVAVSIYEKWKDLPVEAWAIAAVLLLNAVLGVLQERRSEKALAQLKALTPSRAWVRRDGKLVDVASRDIVPGDVVRIEAGERIPADGTLLEGVGVLADEAVLTGESLPVDKAIGAELQSGTLLVRGQGTFRVSRTGPRSAMGEIATMLGEVETDKTPLERQLATLGGRVARWIGALTVVLIAGGLWAEGLGQVGHVVMFAVALAVAGIPEGMPAVVTLTLALGVQRMARRQALVRRLSAVEALGSVTVIATDKTGTLTEEKMHVAELESDDHDAALLAMVLANDADTHAAVGDPVDMALLAYAEERGVDIGAVREANPRVGGLPFDSSSKCMTVTIASASGRTTYVKGAPEVLLESDDRSPEQRARWLDRAHRAAAGGYKVLALARRDGEREVFLGLVTLWDPPRPEVPAAIASARRAGVRVLMITGDHAETARSVAVAVGIPDPTVLTGRDLDRLAPDELREATRTANVFARVTPQHKLKLVEALKADGEIVAMTGDGVNDAPALKRADIGIAMGRRGSDVTREVADLVLLDDNFASIVGAIEEGRGIYENIQTFIRFTFSTNVALMVLVVTGAIAAYAQGLRDASGALLLPLTALQLLWINFLGDGPPALALALDRTPGHMDRPPRAPSSGLLDRASTRFILATGAFKGALGIAMLLLLPFVGFGLVVTQTAIFLYESVGKLVSAYPARRVARGRPANWVLHASIVLGVGLQLVTIAIPGLRRFLGLAAIDVWMLLILTCAVVATWAIAALTSRLVSGPPADAGRPVQPAAHSKALETSPAQ